MHTKCSIINWLKNILILMQFVSKFIIFKLLLNIYKISQLLNAYGSAAASAMGYGTPSALMARSQQQQQQQQMLGIYNTPVAAHQQVNRLIDIIHIYKCFFNCISS
jgi:hypothetical protein